MKERMNSKIFKSKAHANEFVSELKKQEQLEIQIWEHLPDPKGKIVYVVLWGKH